MIVGADDEAAPSICVCACVCVLRVVRLDIPPSHSRSPSPFSIPKCVISVSVFWVM
jgi:hypothetical protein